MSLYATHVTDIKCKTGKIPNPMELVNKQIIITPCDYVLKQK